MFVWRHGQQSCDFTAIAWLAKKNFGAYGHHSITADKNSRLKTFYLDGFRCRRLEGKLQDLGPLDSVIITETKSE